MKPEFITSKIKIIKKNIIILQNAISKDQSSDKLKIKLEKEKEKLEQLKDEHPAEFI